MEPTLPVFLYRLERRMLSEAITQQLPAVAQQLGQEDADAAFTFTRPELEVMIEGLHLHARFGFAFRSWNSASSFLRKRFSAMRAARG